MRGLKDKVIVVAGGASGIGAATARRLGAEGAKVVIGDLNLEGAEKTAAEIEADGGTARPCRYDASVEESVRDLIAVAVTEFGGLDGLHNNAADLSPDIITKDADAVTTPLEVWHRTLTVNLTGYLLGIRYAIPRLLERGGGAIVNTSSGAAFCGEPVRVSYGVSKAGIGALTRHVASAFGKQGIRCNAVAPGYVPLESMKQLTEQTFGVDADVIMNEVLTTVRAPRLGTPEDVAGMVAFLLSDDGQWVTGQVYGVDGGWLLR
ncbi:MAG TPA: SDR family oxidoreductase [Pseudonocardia sp.]|jgi:NAD(P)-dependent dehydrogenase (short-subunit alcohol dehydrogenase family)